MTHSLPCYATDTHPLVWHLRRSKRLRPKARALFEQTDQGQAQIIIPAIVFVEVMYLAEHNRITTQLFEVTELIKISTNYLIRPLDEVIIAEAQTLARTIELHDRLIAATAKALGVPLITKDEELRRLSVIQTIW